MILPFVVLLAAIALGPVCFSDWWSKHYSKVAIGLGAVTAAYYVFGLHAQARVAHVAQEYVSFIALIGSLFVVSGGIHISVKGEATPRANTVFLLVGAVIANLLGTTGASMLLIRPWIRMNKYRITAHHVVFFIFIVSNVGGCLTPIGDPPLFLGYLIGVPFWWIAKHCWPIWMTGVGLLLVLFYIVDLRNYRRAPKAVRAELAEPPDQWRFEGLWNLVCLAVVLGAVFVSRPVFLREALMAGAAAVSYFLTNRKVHQANHFNFHPVKEVAILFAGIFATMLPALEWLQASSLQPPDAGPAFYFWSAGILSSVLDNAPTYLSFLSMQIGQFITPEMLQELQRAAALSGAGDAAISGPHAEAVRSALAILRECHGTELAAGTLTQGQMQVAFLLGNPAWSRVLVAISVGAVFFGANTYIGNGPNFMVKAIADHQKVSTPSFGGYVLRYALPFMVPMLIVVWWVFFRR
jgi:Na+/H+ antiporter NhaD/arsenite permease-like protein